MQQLCPGPLGGPHRYLFKGICPTKVISMDLYPDEQLYVYWKRLKDSFPVVGQLP